MGWGVFNRLPRLSALPLTRVRELSRLVVHQAIDDDWDAIVRAPREVGVALARLLTGALAEEVAAVVGWAEESTTAQLLAAAHWPAVLLRGVLPWVPKDGFFAPAVRRGCYLCFAVWTTDLKQAETRLQAGEAALALGDTACRDALLRLWRTRRIPSSSLVPTAGLPLLLTTAAYERETPPAERERRWRRGRWLQSVPLFQDLSLAEAITLGTRLVLHDLEPGARAVPEDSLWLVEHGAVVRHDSAATHAPTTDLGPADFHGVAALVSGSGGGTSVLIARQASRLLELSRPVYQKYLAPLPRVAAAFDRAAHADTDPSTVQYSPLAPTGRPQDRRG
jgi:hypothetical protein